jgi:putative ABC transport system substrate-binding protein
VVIIPRARRKGELTESNSHKQVIPIVFAVGIDPVGSGLVASLAQPGGNVTGLSIQANELVGKRIELARELVPQLRRLAIMFNIGNVQPVLEMGETQAAARMLGLEVVPLVIQKAEDIASSLQGLKTRADAVYVAVDQLMVANRTTIVASALAADLPTIFSTSDFVKAGAAPVLRTKLHGTVPTRGGLCG